MVQNCLKEGKLRCGSIACLATSIADSARFGPGRLRYGKYDPHLVWNSLNDLGSVSITLLYRTVVMRKWINLVFVILSSLQQTMSNY